MTNHARFLSSQVKPCIRASFAFGLCVCELAFAQNNGNWQD